MRVAADRQAKLIEMPVLAGRCFENLHRIADDGPCVFQTSARSALTRSTVGDWPPVMMVGRGRWIEPGDVATSRA